MTQTPAALLALNTLQIVLVLAFAPLISGWIKKTKAFLQNRQGPSLAQPYRDLIKWFRREAVVADQASWLFQAIPVLVFAASLTAAMLVPVAFTPLPAAVTGDLIAVTALLALGRFLLALAGLDTGSAFGGMGASRDTAVSALAEPALILSVFTVAMVAGTTSLSGMVGAILNEGMTALSAPHILALAGLFIVVLAETGRIPVDNPDTHLELTMIHEGALLQYSGHHLALLHLAAQVRQLLLYALLSDLFFPWGLAGPGLQGAQGAAALALGVLAFLVKALVLGTIVALVEMSVPKMRLLRVPQLLGGSFMLSLLALVAERFMGVR